MSIRYADLKRIKEVPYWNAGKIAFDDFSVSKDDQYARPRYGKPNKLDIAQAFKNADLYTIARENTEKNSKFKQQGITEQNQQGWLFAEDKNMNKFIGMSQAEADKKNISEAKLNALEKANTLLETLINRRSNDEGSSGNGNGNGSVDSNGSLQRALFAPPSQRSSFVEDDDSQSNVSEYSFEPMTPRLAQTDTQPRTARGFFQRLSEGVRNIFSSNETDKAQRNLPYNPRYETEDIEVSEPYLSAVLSPEEAGMGLAGMAKSQQGADIEAPPERASGSGSNFNRAYEMNLNFETQRKLQRLLDEGVLKVNEDGNILKGNKKIPLPTDADSVDKTTRKIDALYMERFERRITRAKAKKDKTE